MLGSFTFNGARGRRGDTASAADRFLTIGEADGSRAGFDADGGASLDADGGTRGEGEGAGGATLRGEEGRGDDEGECYGDDEGKATVKRMVCFCVCRSRL